LGGVSGTWSSSSGRHCIVTIVIVGGVNSIILAIVVWGHSELFPRCASGIGHEYFVVLRSFLPFSTAVTPFHVFMSLQCCNSITDLACNSVLRDVSYHGMHVHEGAQFIGIMIWHYTYFGPYLLHFEMSKRFYISEYRKYYLFPSWLSSYKWS
jgi:hypothetical protein